MAKAETRSSGSKNLVARRQRRLVGRHLVIVKRPDAARNGKPHKVFLTHGLNSRALMRGVFDMRSSIGKQYAQRCAELTAHVGGEPTVAQRCLIDSAARLGLLKVLASAELSRLGAFKGSGEQRACFDSLRKAITDEAALLKMLGLQRAEKPIQTLQEYLSEREQDQDQGSNDA